MEKKEILQQILQIEHTLSYYNTKSYDNEEKLESELKLLSKDIDKLGQIINLVDCKSIKRLPCTSDEQCFQLLQECKKLVEDVK